MTDFTSNLVLSSEDVPSTSASSLVPSVACSMACRRARGNGQPWNYPLCNAFVVENVAGVETCRMGYITPTWFIQSEEMGSGVELFTDILV